MIGGSVRTPCSGRSRKIWLFSDVTGRGPPSRRYFFRRAGPSKKAALVGPTPWGSFGAEDRAEKRDASGFGAGDRAEKRDASGLGAEDRAEKPEMFGLGAGDRAEKPEMFGLGAEDRAWKAEMICRGSARRVLLGRAGL